MEYIFITQNLPPWWVFALAFLGIATIVHQLSDNRKKEYDANFSDAGNILSRFNKGFVVDGIRKLSKNDSYRNFLVCGGVGSFKSSSIVTPFLRSVKSGLIIVNDISGELLTNAGGHMKQNGFNIIVLKMRSPEFSSLFNPLHRCKTKGQANRIAQAIVESSLKSKGDPFWQLQAQSLIAMMIWYLVTHEPAHANLPNVHHLLKMMQGDPKAMDSRFAKSSEDLYLSYRSFLGFGEKTLGGITASSLAATQICSDPDVASVISGDDLGDFGELRKSNTAIFVQNSVTDLKYLQFITDLFYGQLAESILDRMPDEDDKDVWFVLDEFASSMRLPNAGSLLATMRKTRTGFMLIAQDAKNQLRSTYGTEAEVITNNCFTKIYLSGGLDLETAQHLEKRAGKFEWEDEKGQRRIRELITADEILKIEPKRGLLDVGSHSLMQVKLTPYFERFNLLEKEPSKVLLTEREVEPVKLLPARPAPELDEEEA